MTDNFQEPFQPRLIVFVGPPCSGKSPLSRELEAERNGAVRLEMDCIRQEILPDSDHGRGDRNIAYREMHRRAERALARGPGEVILVATYAPQVHRQSLARLARKFNAVVFLVECFVSPDDAVDRFRERELGHAGVDLTESRVRQLAATWPYYGGGLRLDTSADPYIVCRERLLTEVDEEGRLWDIEDWVQQKLAHTCPTQSQNLQVPEKISPASRSSARIQIAWRLFFALAVLALGICGLISFAQGAHNVALVWLTVAILVAASVGVFDFLARPALKRAFGLLAVGTESSYAPVGEVLRSNREVCRDYRARMTRVDPDQTLLANGIPIYFLIQPERGVRLVINVTPEGSRWDSELLSSAAAKAGFTWTQYLSWRSKAKGSEYYGRVSRLRRRWEKTLRVTSIEVGESEGSKRHVGLAGTAARYTDYLVAEQSVGLAVPGQLPYMREFFEGDDWRTHNVDLSHLSKASERYSLMANVNAIVTTDDGFVLLQKRSGHVQAGTSSVAASAAGGVKWNDTRKSRRNSEGPIACALYRELREETGLKRHDFHEEPHPFLAAAFNLRYGRDLNFYAHLRCKLTRDEVASRFTRRRMPWEWLTGSRRDRWEIAHLLFVRISDVLDIESPARAALERQIGDSRHVRGALHAFRVTWEEAWDPGQDDPTPPSSVSPPPIS